MQGLRVCIRLILSLWVKRSSILTSWVAGPADMTLARTVVYCCHIIIDLLKSPLRGMTFVGGFVFFPLCGTAWGSTPGLSSSYTSILPLTYHGSIPPCLWPSNYDFIHISNIKSTNAFLLLISQAYQTLCSALDRYLRKNVYNKMRRWGLMSWLSE